eukprot:7145648-Prorocentrum_lima.AAC.1
MFDDGVWYSAAVEIRTDKHGCEGVSNKSSTDKYGVTYAQNALLPLRSGWQYTLRQRSCRTSRSCLMKSPLRRNMS